MRAPRTEKLLTLLRCFHAGEEESDDVLSALEMTYENIRRTRQMFLIESANDVGMSSFHRERIGETLKTYLDTLNMLLEAVADSDSEQIDILIDEVERNVSDIRAAQDDQRAELAQGPTHFPFLNRVLLEYEAVRAGGDKKNLVTLLGKSSIFLRFLRTELGARGVSPLKIQSVFHLQQALESLELALVEERESTNVRSELEELSGQLAGLLASPLLASSDSGPTPFPGINQVLVALTTVSDSREDTEYFSQLVDQHQHQLRASVGLSCPAEHLDLLDLVLDDLGELKQCVLDGASRDEVTEIRTELMTNAIELFDILGGNEDPTEAYSDSLDGLPVLFSSLLLPAFRFLDGQSSADDVYNAAEAMEGAVDELIESTDGLPQEHEAYDLLQDAFESMREVAEMLRQLAECADRQYLEIATSLCYHAAESLSQADY